LHGAVIDAAVRDGKPEAWVDLFLLHVIYVEETGMEHPDSSRFEIPQGTLDLLVLQIVALGPIHGYAIAQRLQQVSREVLQVQQGTLYPALHRLENKGFLKAEWKESETKREAKFYRLSPKGRKQLEAETAKWTRLTEVVALVLQLSREGAL
jgi:PadR family transcriptional regulator PadR